MAWSLTLVKIEQWNVRRLIPYPQKLNPSKVSHYMVAISLYAIQQFIIAIVVDAKIMKWHHIHNTSIVAIAASYHATWHYIAWLGRQWRLQRGFWKLVSLHNRPVIVTNITEDRDFVRAHGSLTTFTMSVNMTKTLSYYVSSYYREERCNKMTMQQHTIASYRSLAKGLPYS